MPEQQVDDLIAEAKDAVARLIEVRAVEVPKGGLLHVKMGANAEDMGGGSPWIPHVRDIEEMEEAIFLVLDRLGLDIPVIVTHRWVEIVPIAPSVEEDFDGS